MERLRKVEDKMGKESKIIRLIADPHEIDPYVIEKHEVVAVKLLGMDDAENLEGAVLDLKRGKQDYSVDHLQTDEGVPYVVLRRKAA
jgi:hypothetical protein